MLSAQQHFSVTVSEYWFFWYSRF